MTRLPKIYLKILLLGCLLGSCGAEENTANTTAKIQPTIIFAASSLSEPLYAIKEAFLATQPTANLEISTASSAQLARQIIHGAPAALFLSANQFWIDDLKNKQLISTPKPIAGNKLVLAATTSSLTNTSIALDVATYIKSLPPFSLAIADPALSPLGRYTQTLLERYDVWQHVEGHLVLAPNAIRTRAFVETGQTELAILYHSDTINNPRLKPVINFAIQHNPKVIYWAAVNDSYKYDKIVMEFFSFLTSEKAQDIFTTYGFLSQNDATLFNP